MRNVLLILLAFVLTSFTSVEKVNLNNYSNQSLLQQNKLESDWKEIKKAILAKDLKKLAEYCESDEIKCSELINAATWHHDLDKQMKTSTFEKLRLFEYEEYKIYIFESAGTLIDRGETSDVSFQMFMADVNGRLKIRSYK
jgi:hypothetical protein